ncbi:MAG: tRNA (adenosine(37)-N6)-threonylcarbamoyltransferase complex dimerization subunit type 1 TsaB [Pseudonocardiaceae bacterium]
MTLTLAIETSSNNYSIALCTPQDIITCQTIRRDDPAFEGIGSLVSSTLSAAGREFQDIQRLAVNIGPGNLGSVRAGVAYANGLAFSLQRLIYCADSLSLLAAEVAESSDENVLCLRNAGSGSVYAGLFRGGRNSGMGHGPMDLMVSSLVGDLAKISVAGAFRQEVKGLLPDVLVRDTGIETPHVSTLHRVLLEKGSDIAELVPFASPLNDSSPMFHG